MLESQIRILMPFHPRVFRLSMRIPICLAAYRSGTKHNQQHNNQQSFVLVEAIDRVLEPDAPVDFPVWKVDRPS